MGMPTFLVTYTVLVYAADEAPVSGGRPPAVFRGQLWHSGVVAVVATGTTVSKQGGGGVMMGVVRGALLSETVVV